VSADVLEIAPARADEDPGASLLAAFEVEIAELYEDWDRAVGPSASPAELSAPHGAFLLVSLDGTGVGCGGVKRLSDGVAEIKRMFVDPEVRGRGVARRLLGALESAARELGYTTVRLDTGRFQPDAHHLYSTAGYRAIPDYNGNPYASFWFEKAL